ncbi:hypothetical protein D3C73_1289640 [compost metagenome]
MSQLHELRLLQQFLSADRRDGHAFLQRVVDLSLIIHQREMNGDNGIHQPLLHQQQLIFDEHICFRHILSGAAKLFAQVRVAFELQHRAQYTEFQAFNIIFEKIELCRILL